MRSFLKRGLLYAGKYLGLFRLARALTSRSLRILCYHGFSFDDEHEFRPLLFMSEETFRQRLDVLAEKGYPVLPLGEAVQRLRGGDLPRCAVTITIDDGWHGVQAIARPELVRRGFPATVYVTTYYVARNNLVFRIAVQYLFWKSDRSRVELPWPWLEPGAVDLQSSAECDAAVSAIIEHGESSCSEDERQIILAELGEALEVDRASLESRRQLCLMTAEELLECERDGISVELHTHRHRFPLDDQAEVERELTENRELLEGWIGRRCEHFCYPSGVWKPHQHAWLEQLGVTTATTCDVGLNTPQTPPLALRRFLDGENILPIEFEAELSGYLEILRKFRSLLRIR